MKKVFVGLLMISIVVIGYFYFSSKVVEAPKTEEKKQEEIVMLTVASSSKQIVKENYNINFDFPFTNQEKIDSEISKIVDTSISTFEQEISNFNPAPTGIERPYTLSGTYKSYLGNKYDNFVFLISIDFGGAHPNHFYKTLTFDKNQNVVSIQNILDKELSGISTVDKISQLVIMQITKKLGVNANPEMIEAGAGPNIENFRNFYIEGDEIVFIFEPYAVAAYAYSSQEARIKFSDLKM